MIAAVDVLIEDRIFVLAELFALVVVEVDWLVDTLNDNVVSFRISRRNRGDSLKQKLLFSQFNQHIRVLFIVNEISLSLEIVDGININVERIAPKAINKCNQRIDIADGRAHKRL